MSEHLQHVVNVTAPVAASDVGTYYYCGFVICQGCAAAIPTFAPWPETHLRVCPAPGGQR
jgi:hypothetical protein